MQIIIKAASKTPFETKQLTEEFTSASGCEIENEGFWRLPKKEAFL